jgi:hypothetical protein
MNKRKEEIIPKHVRLEYFFYFLETEELKQSSAQEFFRSMRNIMRVVENLAGVDINESMSVGDFEYSYLFLEELKVYVRNFKNRVVFIGENGAAMFFEHICCPENFASKYREKYLKNEIQPIVSVQNTQGENLW